MYQTYTNKTIKILKGGVYKYDGIRHLTHIYTLDVYLKLIYFQSYINISSDRIKTYIITPVSINIDIHNIQLSCLLLLLLLTLSHNSKYFSLLVLKERRASKKIPYSGLVAEKLLIYKITKKVHVAI